MSWEILACVVCVTGALVALVARSFVRAILGLALLFVGLASLYAMLGAWYLAAGQLFLFVGGVVTLLVLVFSMARTRLHRTGSLAGAVLALVVACLLALRLPQAPAPGALSLQTLSTGFFSAYGALLVPAILLLFSAVMTARHLLGEET
jgi:NADH:ubiquinone oxidoreductase subunit 6 (subunit J)